MATIQYRNGDRTSVPSEAEAIAILRGRGYVVAAGARVLAWESEADARDDDGRRAVAEVVRITR